MRRREPRPPRLARRVVEWAAGRLGTTELADDARELFAERAERDGPGPARRWYRRQAVDCIVRLLREVWRWPGRRASAGLSAGVLLDAKLAFRMLARYPGLTVVGGVAMAFAIFVGASAFKLVGFFVAPTPPLPEGDRVVGVRYWDRSANDPRWPLPDDLRVWREELTTVQHLGAYEMVDRRMGDGDGEPVEVARISSEGFRLAGVPALLGRTLVEADEAPGAAPTVLLGHDVWRARFGGDPSVVGRAVRLGSGRATVVGVMPEGFDFPGRARAWMPLRLDDPPVGSEADRALRVFGRLAPGATLERAGAELTAIASPTLAPAGGGGRVHEAPDHLAAEVLPFLQSVRSVRAGLVMRVLFYQLNVYAALFLLLVASNVALLMFARAVARGQEIVVRTALGAGRWRIVTQLFVEALVLGTLATTAGLMATPPALGWIRRQVREMGGDLPYGLDPGITPGIVAYAALLTVLGAGVAGAFPALKATGRDVQARLRQAAAGSGGWRLGGIWTVVVVTQIGATVVFTAGAYLMAHQARRAGSLEASFPAERYLGVRVEMEGESGVEEQAPGTAGFQHGYATRLRELERRLIGTPGVGGVTLTRQLPTKGHPSGLVEVAGGGGAPLPEGRAGYEVARGAVDLDAFDVLQTPILAGRGFTERDLDEGARGVVVNASFVEEVLGGRSAVGRRVRYLDRAKPDEPGPWHEIVGVVRNVVADSTRSLDLQDRPRARVYHPLDPAHAGDYPLHLVLLARGDPERLVPEVYRTAESVSPALRVHEPVTLDWADPGLARGWRLYAELLSIVSGVALLLGLSGIYAVMSFTVARRRREIGVRVALGARQMRVLAEIFRRPLIQVGTGIAVGCVLVAVGVAALTPGKATIGDGGRLLVLCLGMLCVSALACVVPTLRALRVQPAEALSAEG